jgi:hypothetical protein
MPSHLYVPASLNLIENVWGAGEGEICLLPDWPSEKLTEQAPDGGGGLVLHYID